LKEQTEALLSRKQIIESLQANRTETVHLFNELARQVPSGVYLKSVKQAGQKITLNGLAQSNAKVSTLMRNLDDSPVLEKPDLVEIKAVTVDKRRLSDFTLRIQFTRQQSSEETKAAPAGRPPAGTAKPTRKDGKS
jgi:type IV pilus assembly protein PilN